MRGQSILKREILRLIYLTFFQFNRRNSGTIDLNSTLLRNETFYFHPHTLYSIDAVRPNFWSKQGSISRF